MAVCLRDRSYSLVPCRIFLNTDSVGVSLYCKGSKRKGDKLVQDLGMEVT